MDILASGLRFPEGPIALEDGGVLLVEIERQSLTRVGADGRVSVVAELPGGPNGAALGPDGAVFVCNNGGFMWMDRPETGLRPHGTPPDYAGGRIERVDLRSGRVETLYDSCDGHRLNGPNDLVFDRHGGFWFTDFGKMRERDIDRGAVYYALADGSAIRQVVFPLFTPNGVGLSPAEDRLYVAETYTNRIWAFDVVAPGEIARRPFPPSPNGGEVIYAPGGYQAFDSLAVDEAGRLCVATIYNGGITIIDPATGAGRHVPMPDPLTTNICFGGEDGHTAYVTLSSTGRLARLNWDAAGLPLNFGAGQRRGSAPTVVDRAGA